MRSLIPLLLLVATCSSASAQRFVKVFDTIAAMLAANPNDVHTNAYVAGRTIANDGGGGIYTWHSTSTASTNSNLSILKANNFTTGRWLRDNGFLLTALTTDRVAVIGSDSVLTNSIITITQLNTLSNVTSDIQEQIDNIVAGNNNWQNEGTTNSTLPGIGKPWAIETTNHISVGIGSTSAGVIDISSTNGTHTVRITVDEDGTLVIAHGSTNMLTLQLGSLAGHTGTGTNFLADDGTFKPGGGDSLWELSGTSIIPTDSGKTFTFTEDEELLIGTDGMLYLAGDPGVAEVFGGGEGAVQPYFDLLAGTSPDQVYLELHDSGGELRTGLSPMVDQTETPYLLDTWTNHTSGFLVEVRNMGTNMLTVAAVSGYTGGGTKALFDDGTYKTTSAVGNQTKTLPLFRFPDSVDGAGCTYVNTNNFTARTFMRPRFSATGATNANFATFSCLVPSDLNTAVDLTATLKVSLVAGDTAASTYTVGMASVANSASSSPTAANYVTLTVPADGSGSVGDVEGVNNVTLTGWRSAMTAGQWLFIQLQRDGSDASATDEDLLALEITYTSTQ